MSSTLDSREADVLWAQFRALTRARRWTDALAVLDEIEERYPDDSPFSVAIARADVLRRDDRLVRAFLALGDWGFHPDPRTSAFARMLMAGILLDGGMCTDARGMAESALEDLPPSPERALVLDTLAAARIECGDLDGAREAMAELARLDTPSTDAASAFRLAELHTLAGKLDEAEEQLRRCETLRRPGWDPLEFRGAIMAQRGEIALRRRDPDGAVAAFEESARARARAQRRRLAFSSELGRFRAVLLRGGTVHPAPLTRILDYAEERGLSLLAVEARRVRGAARARAGLDGALDDLREAVETAESIGARLAHARARAVRAAHAPGAHDGRALAALAQLDRAWGSDLV